MGKTQSKKMRESGFELVRIIAMVLIVANHLMNHGIFKVTSQTPYSLFPQMSPLNQAVSAVISCGGRIGVAVFFMITGYFLADREKLSPRSVLSFLGRVHFFGILMFAFYMVLRLTTGYESDLDLGRAARLSLCIPAVLWWFALAYLILLFLAPSINVLIRYLDRKAVFLLIILYVWFFFYKSGSEQFIPVNFIKAVLFYMMGAFVRICGQNRRLKEADAAASAAGSVCSDFTSSAAGLFVHVIVFVILFLVSGYIMLDVIRNTTADAGTIGRILFWKPDSFLNDVLIPLDGLALLLVGQFRFTSRIVNRISACTFSVYLLHEYTFTRPFLWHDLLKADTVQYKSSLFPLFVLLDVAVIFLAGIIVETIRLRLAELFVSAKKIETA